MPTTALPYTTSPDPRAIDPTECWVRHVVRGAEGETSAITVARAIFVREDLVSGVDGLNGRQGWQQGSTTAVLGDDGEFQLVFANVAGDDGVLHRRRFQILTNPDYEPGEEWLEFYVDPNDLLYVGTPTDYVKTPSTITIKGADLPTVLQGSISSDVDVWDAAAPADVFEHYSRLAVLAFGDDLEEVQTGGVGSWSGGYKQLLSGVEPDCWICEARLRWVSARPAASGTSKVRVDIAGLSLIVDMREGETILEGAPERPVTGKNQGLLMPGGVDLRIVVRYDHVYAFVAGELIAEFRRPPAWPGVPSVTVYAYGGSVAIDGLHIETLAPFAARGLSAVIERQLPGSPPPTGLRGQYWNAAPEYAQNATREGRLARLWTVLAEEAACDRVDPTVNFPSGTALYAPNVPGAYATRWSGAIFLDLTTTDRNIRLKGLVGNVRVYIGKTLRGQELVSSWFEASAATLTSASLREWLAEEAGWYPIVIEQAHEAAAAGMILEDRAGTGAYAVVPQSRLSPIGCYSETVRLTDHRKVLGEVAQAFGYQWRVEYRGMESGEFPGALSFKSLIGLQTNVVIDDQVVGSAAQVSGSAGDVVDGILADAAGLANPTGSGQLTAQAVDYSRADGHMALRQVYESLSEISEEPMLKTRVDSLLELRSSPNEQVGVRPRGQRDLVDTLPLTGAHARLDWQPGDAPILELDSVDVKDESPRQMTSVTRAWVPDGLGALTVGFRQRPRSPRAALKHLSAVIYGPRRNYQGGIAISTGSLGGLTSGGGAVAGAADGFSRAPLPASLGAVVKVIAVVHFLEGVPWRLEVTGVDLGTDGAVATVGRYDVTRSAKAQALGAPYVYARLIDGASGAYLLTLEVWMTV
jgi:hypothetical protein